MGAGSVLDRGSFRFSLNTARGYGFEGSHPETKGLDSNGQIVSVPLHRHEVSLDYLRLELEFEYALTDRWTLALRVPYDIKDQRADVESTEPVSPQEKQQILDNGYIHHRPERYRGLSDLMLLATHRKEALFREGDSLGLSLGTTLPTGTTEEDPFELGYSGLKHLHIQFGTGTFDPLLELNYSMPVAGKLGLGAYALARFPVYENSKTYQGPAEITSGVLLEYSLNRCISLHVNGSAYYQSFAYWDRERDINSGLIAMSSMFGIAVEAWEHTTLGLDLRYPLSQRIRSDGDAFKQGPTLLFRIAWEM